MPAYYDNTGINTVCVLLNLVPPPTDMATEPCGQAVWSPRDGRDSRHPPNPSSQKVLLVAPFVLCGRPQVQASKQVRKGRGRRVVVAELVQKSTLLGGGAAWCFTKQFSVTTT